ncbi:hypothetical protein [Paenibacillus wulumuqiensis]|uniref:hypothetical protein n=1 Tax=Paenibacillus wulumuqiensis TaxID=1567107 RepID=UPI000619FBFC|nr:hypothetical protein [Paenibacillus wulumuqiensis]
MDNDALQFLVFWSINDALHAEPLKRQLDELQACGIQGVVFHPRYYPDHPPYMSQDYLDVLSEVILYARSIGMIFWIYDENGWPSGTASGQVIARHPELVCEWLEWTGDHSGQQNQTVIRSRSAVSSLDREATKAFIEITHEGYRKGLQPKAFEYVTGFFSDEVGFLDGHSVSVEKGGVPWYRELPERYRIRYGEALEPLLPLLFIEEEEWERNRTAANARQPALTAAGKESFAAGDNGRAADAISAHYYHYSSSTGQHDRPLGRAQELRIRYWELLTDALIEGFYRPIAEWCARHGKLFTGHLKGEENPFFQLPHSGSCFSVLQGLTLPGIDALERYPGNDFYPRMVHSISMQQGRSGCLAEAHGGSGWGVTPATFSRYMLWLAGHGLRQLVLHLSQYELGSQAVHDWPPSLPLHLSWRKAFPAVLQSIRERVQQLPDLRSEQPELLIVTPTRGVMAYFQPDEAMVINVHDGDGVPDTPAGRISNSFMELVECCHQAGVHYEFTEERTLEETAIVKKGSVCIGARSYSRVMLASGCVWQAQEGDSHRTLIDRMIEAGITLIEPDDLYLYASSRNKAEQGKYDTLAVTDHPEKRVRYADLTPVVAAQSPWIMTRPASNSFTLYWEDKDSGWWSTRVKMDGDSLASQAALFQLVMLDQPLAVMINDQYIAVDQKGNTESTKRPYRYGIEASLLGGREDLHISVQMEPMAEPDPVAFLEGEFLVYSDTPYRPKDERQCYTSGPLRITGMPNKQNNQTIILDPGSLIESGFPFYSDSVEMSATLSVSMDELKEGSEALYLQLTGVDADAAYIQIDGQSAGYCWAPDWKIELPSEIGEAAPTSNANGKNWHDSETTEILLEITVELIPSTYNRYGPHLHRDGDRHVVSPDQYRGIKNFADDPDAPSCTRGEDYHFVNCGITGEVRLLRGRSFPADIKVT